MGICRFWRLRLPPCTRLPPLGSRLDKNKWFLFENHDLNQFWLDQNPIRPVSETVLCSRLLLCCLTVALLRAKPHLLHMLTIAVALAAMKPTKDFPGCLDITGYSHKAFGLNWSHHASFSSFSYLLTWGCRLVAPTTFVFCADHYQTRSMHMKLSLLSFPHQGWLLSFCIFFV